MKRKTFIKNSFIASTAALTRLSSSDNWQIGREEINNLNPSFKTKFSPEFNIFTDSAGEDPVDQIKWGYDNGFRAWESTYLLSKPVEEQEKISQAIQKLEMDFGQFVGSMNFNDVTFAGRDSGLRDKVLKDVRASVEVAKRMNTKIIHNVLDKADPRLPMDFQMANAIELLKRVADIYEPHGIVMVMESMNHKVNHPGMFLHTIPQAYALTKAVGSPSVKILFDFYHVQIEEGNIIDTLDYAWDEIAYMQIGDVPGRFEPTTGEVNFKNILQYVYDKGYRGFMGLEHSRSMKGVEGDKKIIKAYQSIDAT